ncbi:MAG: phage tail protein [Oscillospiraceae bacterium]|jgi:phage tail-like protein|nr:phage tail protein [Oscillospiraceae bacterium]
MAEERQDLSTGGVLSTQAIPNALGAPIRGFRFTATFDTLGTASFKSVEGGCRIEVQTSEYREGAFGRLTVRKLPGMVTFNDITLTKGVYSNTELYTFFSNFLEGTTLAPVNAVIRAFDNAGVVTASWRVMHAWPQSYESSGLDSNSSEVLIETLVLTNEGVYRDLVPQA